MPRIQLISQGSISTLKEVENMLSVIVFHTLLNGILLDYFVELLLQIITDIIIVFKSEF
jgi:hypothetical protein